jgi:WD40 repeat protein
VCIIEPSSGTLLHNVALGSPFWNNDAGSLAYAPNGVSLAVATEAGHLVIIDTRVGVVLQRIHIGCNHGGSFAFSPSGLNLALAGWSTGQASEIELPYGTVLFHKTLGHGKVDIVAYSPLGNGFAVGSASGHVCMIESSSGRVFGDVKLGRSYVGHLAYQTTGENLAAGCDDGHIYIIELISCTILLTISIGPGRVESLVRFSSSEKLAACASGVLSTIDMQVGMTLQVDFRSEMWLWTLAAPE